VFETGRVNKLLYGFLFVGHKGLCPWRTFWWGLSGVLLLVLMGLPKSMSNWRMYGHGREAGSSLRFNIIVVIVLYHFNIYAWFEYSRMDFDGGFTGCFDM
jgi:hypothetical protein